MTVATLVRVAMEHHRAQGVEFMTAWTRSLQSIPRGPHFAVKTARDEWVDALKWSRPAWEAAYVGGAYDVVIRSETETALVVALPERDESPELAIAS